MRRPLYIEKYKEKINTFNSTNQVSWDVYYLNNHEVI